MRPRGSTRPRMMSGIPQERITLDYQMPLPRAQLPDIIRGLVEPRGLIFKEDSSFYSIGPRPAPVQPTSAPGAGSGSVRRDSVAMFVIRLKHAHAADVAATVNLLFGGTGEFSGSGGVAAGTLSEELRRNVVTPDRPPERGTPAPATVGAKSATLTGPVTIVPDERTNSLLVRA